jgi:hypothetical protein
VADLHAADGADGCALGAAGAVAEEDEDRGVGDIAQGEVGGDDILDDGAVDGLEGEAAGAVEGAVGDGDVAEVAVGLGADLDAAGGAVAVGRVGDGAAEGAVEERADVVAADGAVGDGDVLAGAQGTEGVAGLEDDGVVVGGVDGAVGDADVAAAVDVETVAVGVDAEVVEGEVVDAGGEDGEVAAVEDGEIAEGDAAAVLERDGLVAQAEGPRARGAGGRASAKVPLGPVERRSWRGGTRPWVPSIQAGAERVTLSRPSPQKRLLSSGCVRSPGTGWRSPPLVGLGRIVGRRSRCGLGGNDVGAGLELEAEAAAQAD